MRKIPTLYRRNPEDLRRLLPEVHPDCQWVLDGEGIATIKYDGTCTKLDDSGQWWARREVKKDRQPPANFVAVEHDPATGKTVGWEPMVQSPFVKQHREAVEFLDAQAFPGTYELIGPKINGNPHNFSTHQLMVHGADVESTAPRDFEGLREWLKIMRDTNIEGIVWHHPDGRRAKIKVRDFAGGAE